MKKLLYFAFASVVLFGLPGCASPERKIVAAQYFTYPDAEIIISSGPSQATIEPAANYSHPQMVGERPSFRGGFGHAGFPSVEYEFVGKCDQGDVYIFSLEVGDKVTKVVPFIYSGKKASVLEQENVKIVLQPKKG